MGTLGHLLKKNRTRAAQVSPVPINTEAPSPAKPRFLWIDCSESHFSPKELVGLSSGEFLIHRNLANLVSSTDPNVHSILQYAVDHHHVEHIIVCGHYGCGGVRAALEENQTGTLDDWLSCIRSLNQEYEDELFYLVDEVNRLNRLCELNVIAQVHQVCESFIVKRTWQRGYTLTVHGWIVDPITGILHDLGIEISEPSALQERAPVKETSHREGIVIVGAGSTARTLAKVLSRTESVRLVDSNAYNCFQSQHEGLQVIQGNALDEDVLAEAHAGRARTFLAMTPNPEVNALAVRLACEVFTIPEIHILSTGNESAYPELAERYGSTTLFAGSVDLNFWDYHIEHAEAATVGYLIRHERAPDRLHQQVRKPVPAFPLAILRQGRYVPLHSASTLTEGDRVILLRMNETQFQPYDRFDWLVWRAVILDIEQALDLEAFFEMAAVALAPALDVTSEELAVRFADREITSSTVIIPGLAVPHVVLEGEGKFRLLLARCQGGVSFPGQSERVHILFVLAGTRDQRNMHLRTLAAIANVAQWPEFELRWLEAHNAEGLRNLVVEAPRRRMPEPSAS